MVALRVYGYSSIDTRFCCIRLREGYFFMGDNEKTQEVACVVCGQKSHRADWVGVENPHCDSHTAEEVAKAVAAKVPSPPAASAS